MENKKTLPLIYVLSMPLIFVLANFVTNLHMEVLDSKLYISVVLYPLLYLIGGLVVRKTTYKDALRMFLITLIAGTLAFVIQWVLFSMANAYVAIYAFLSITICGLLFVFVYDFLIKTNNDNYLTLFILILAITLIDHIFFGAFVEKDLLSSSLLVRAIYIIILPATLSKPLFAKPAEEKTKSKTTKKKTTKE